jgi:hypothetical protein
MHGMLVLLDAGYQKARTSIRSLNEFLAAYGSYSVGSCSRHCKNLSALSFRVMSQMGGYKIVELIS